MKKHHCQAIMQTLQNTRFMVIFILMLTFATLLDADEYQGPRGIEFVKDRAPKNLTVTFDKNTCLTGCCDYLCVSAADIRFSGSSKLERYLGDITNVQKAPNLVSNNKKYCWITFELYDLKTYSYEPLFKKPSFREHETVSWWPRELPDVHTDDVEVDGGIVMYSHTIRQMSRDGNMVIRSTWNGSKETVTAEFKEFKCSFSGRWRTADGDVDLQGEVDDYWTSSTCIYSGRWRMAGGPPVSEGDHVIIETTQREVVRTEYGETPVSDQAVITLNFKPGFSERIVCEIESTANVKYEWLWFYKTKLTNDFVEIDKSLFEVQPVTERKRLIVDEKEDAKDTRLCELQTTTGRMSINMDKEHFTGAQVQCRLVHRVSDRTFVLRRYTAQLAYDWSPQRGSEFTPTGGCLKYQLSFAITTLFAVVIWGFVFKIYREKGALHKEKWRHTRTPSVEPKKLEELLRKHIQKQKGQKSWKSSDTTSSSEVACSKGTTTSKSKSQTKRYNSTQGRPESALGPREQHGGQCALTSRGYRYSAQYYADLKACLLDTDQTYDDKECTLRSRHRGYFMSLTGRAVRIGHVISASHSAESDQSPPEREGEDDQSPAASVE